MLLDLKRKLAILSDAAKYDASCASSGSVKRDSVGGKGMGSTDGGMGICHAYAPDGRCISLLKLLLTNFCVYDCAYCVNRVSSNVPRARFSVEEVVDLTLGFYRRNYIEGLFLSSGIIRSGDYTMEAMVRVAKTLRETHDFRGYIHLKVIPEASPELVNQAGLYADRISINVELPKDESLAVLAPEKDAVGIKKAMGRVRRAREAVSEAGRRAKAPKFAPAGQSTQMIVGADAASDGEILKKSEALYGAYGLKRVYYSAFSPIPDSVARLPLQRPPLMREHRLYQADWLMRFYGFDRAEIVGETEDLDLAVDPKLGWALRNRGEFPVDLNTADRERLLRVPGLGVRSVGRILDLRRLKAVTLDDVRRLTRGLDKLRPFITTSDWSPGGLTDRQDLRERLAPPPQQLDLFLMRVVRLAHETDFEGWRAAARKLRDRGVGPEEVLWTVDAEPSLFPTNEDGDAPPLRSRREFTVPKAFVELAAKAILHRSDERFALLYRLLFRLQKEPDLLHIATDPDLARLSGMARDVSRAGHKMKAFVRFREAKDTLGEAYVAWFEPAHRVTEAVAPFFVRRFTSMRWSILTPDVCAHWDMADLAFTPGADPADAPRDDALEEYWKTYYASIFNPARLKVDAMRKEMPKRYWRNLPEAALIPELIASAQERTAQMVRQAPTTPSARTVKAAIRNSRDAPYDGVALSTLEEVAAGVDHCRRCDLWRDATQGVAGEGPRSASLMFVGEQPGDQEDLAGQPFVGPAGQVLDKALVEAGVPRSETYVTNAVKHFKHELRGKRRIHQTPNAGEVSACRWWLDAERRIVRPRVIVALGATAGSAVFGKATPIGPNRGKALQLPDQAQGVITYHPAYLLRLPDEAAKTEAYAKFVQDLAFASSLVRAKAA